MLEIGCMNRLQANRITAPGCYLTDGEGNDVLLPTKYIPQGIQMGDFLNVFLYKDNQNRPIATTLQPKLLRDQIGVLKVKAQTPTGVFMDWGIEKDLLVPFREKLRDMPPGSLHPVALFLDRTTQRLVGTCKIERFLSQEDIDLEEGEEVDLIAYDRTPLGTKVVVNGRHSGLVFANETFQRLKIGECVKGYVKTIRDDGKLDISLQKSGAEALEEGCDTLLAILKKNRGFLPLHDKSEPEFIWGMLGMSKKTFKRTAGILYRHRMIRIEDDGIYLVKETQE